MPWLRMAPISLGIATAVALVVPIALFAFFTRATIDDQIVARAEQDRAVAARLAADVVSQRLEGDARNLTRVATRADVVASARAHDVLKLDEILANYVDPHSVKSAGIVDAQGTVVANQPVGTVDPSFAKDVAAHAAALTAQQGWMFVAPDGRAPTRPGSVAVIVAPLDAGTERWALYGVLDCTPLANVFLPLSIPSYRSVLLLDETGRAIAGAQPVGAAVVPTCVDIIEWSGYHQYTVDMPGLAQALASPIGSATVRLGGTELLAAHAAVIPGHWVLYVLDSPDAALAGERRLAGQVTTGAGVAAAIAIALAIAFGWLIERLRRQRLELARLAVSEERLRFARDLHDLLGRSLSLIALKADLARRLWSKDPPAAEREVRDLEHVARQALDDVREAVLGHHQPSLATELSAARSALDAAGIDLRVEQEQVIFPETTDALFAWAVREGVTNVIRHSGAARCRVHISRSGSEARLEITDDGQGAGAPGTGRGIAGLTERAATRGGTARARPLPGRGFELVIAVPEHGA